MQYNEFVTKIANGLGLRTSRANDDFICGEHGKIYWICGCMGNSYWAESCFNGITIITWDDTKFATVENGTGPTGGPDEQIIHRIGTLRQCINTAKGLYRK